MVNKSCKNVEACQQSGGLELNVSGVLCRFLCDKYEYFVVQYSNDISPLPSNAFLELSRFNVQGCCCAILQKKPHQEENPDELELNLLLSPRELQIATLVALGCPNKQVADKLHISEWTVGTHLRRIFAKLHVDTRAAMTYRCAALIYKSEQSEHPK